MDNSNTVNFTDIIRNYNIYSHRLIKSMVKISNLDFAMNSHIFKLNKSLYVYFEGNISNRYQTHHEINKNQYSDSILIHIFSRSLNNIILKDIGSYKNYPWNSKQSNIIDLKNIINLSIDNNTFINFKNISKRLHFSYNHAKANKVYIQNFIIKKYLYSVIDLENEKRLLNIYLEKNNIDQEKYYKFAQYISDEILNRKDFIKN